MRRRLWAAPLFLLAILVMLGPAGCGGDSSSPMEPAPAFTDLPPEEALELMTTKDDLWIIDVSVYYVYGYLPGALNDLLAGGFLESQLQQLEPSDCYLVYGHDDEESTEAAQLFIDHGFRDVYRLEGNIGAWIDAGYPVESGFC